jgi:Zn-dependent protease
METIRDLIFVLVPMILSLSFHECCHALAARVLGDRTAQSQGRLTINPMPHIDIYGTILIPAMAVLFHAPFIGWAKPVPVTPVNFTRRITMRTGMTITAAAGPFSNLILAVLSVAAMKLMIVFHISTTVVWLFLKLFLQINIILAIFNLIPLPPLDGATVISGLLPRPYADKFDEIAHHPYFVILGFAVLIAFGGKFLWVPIVFIQNLLGNLFGVPL